MKKIITGDGSRSLRCHMREGGQSFRFSESRNRGRSNVLFLRARVCEDNRARQNFQTAKKTTNYKEIVDPRKTIRTKTDVATIATTFCSDF